jgi:putative NADH-flavin reductase
MKILVIGSTGRTGLQFLNEGLRRGHELTAFTRRPQELAGMQGLRAVVQGDGLNPADLARAVQGQEAVICSVAGVFTAGSSVVTDTSRNLTRAMSETGVRRLIHISAAMIDATRPLLLIQLLKWRFRHMMADNRRAEAVITGSDLDWTIVRPTRLTDQPATGRVRRIYGGTIDSGPHQLSRADLATAVFDTLENPADIGALYEVTAARLRHA